MARNAEAGTRVALLVPSEDLMRKLDRRQFTQEASLAFLAGVTVTVTACGGGGGGGSNAGDSYNPAGGSTTPTTTLPPAPGSKTGQISANHGHEAVVTAAQLQAGGAVQIDIAATAGHSHMVSLPAQAVQEIRDGKSGAEGLDDDGRPHAHGDLQRRGARGAVPLLRAHASGERPQARASPGRRPNFCVE